MPSSRSGPDPGPDALVVITTSLAEAGVDPSQLRARLETSPHVTAVTGADVPPWEGLVSGTGFSREPDDLDTFAFTQTQRVSYGYFSTLGTKTLAGRVFSEEHGDGDEAVTEKRVVIDRMAAEQFGWSDPNEAVGQRIYDAAIIGEPRAATIIGVVEHEPPRVFGWASRAFVYSPDFQGITYPIIRISRDDVAAGLADIDTAWETLAPELPISREFVDERFERSFTSLRYASAGFTALAAVAFVIACMGLLGMVLFVVSRRRHEMGVRKVLGASSPRIMRLLLWQFLRPVLFANLAVWPLAYMAARVYVDVFIRPVSLTPLPFLLSLLVTVLVTGAVVARQAVLSARQKPAAVLRYE